LGVEDWAEIRRLHRAERMPIKQIARVMGCSKNTVKRALAAEGPPRYHRPARESVVDAVEPQVRELLRVWPAMPATVIAELIGWQRSIRVLRDRWPSCARRTCRRIRRRERRTRLGSWPSVTCGSQRSRCRWGSVRPARRPGSRCW
jgi:Helix-turn-helix domain of resolvase